MVNKQSKYQPRFSSEIFQIIDIQSHNLIHVTYSYTVENENYIIRNLSFYQLIKTSQEANMGQLPLVRVNNRQRRELKQLEKYKYFFY